MRFLVFFSRISCFCHNHTGSRGNVENFHPLPWCQLSSLCILTESLCFQVFFLHFPSALLCGEIRKAYVEFCNVGAVALCGLRVASTHPEFFTFGCNNPTPSSPASAEHGSAYKTFAATVQPGSVVSEVEVCAQDFTQLSGVLEIPIDGGTLHPGQSIQLPLWLRGPDHEGVHEINFLFYYESTEKGLKVR